MVVNKGSEWRLFCSVSGSRWKRREKEKDHDRGKMERGVKRSTGNLGTKNYQPNSHWARVRFELWNWKLETYNITRGKKRPKQLSWWVILKIVFPQRPMLDLIWNLPTTEATEDHIFTEKSSSTHRFSIRCLPPEFPQKLYWKSVRLTWFLCKKVSLRCLRSPP